MRFDDKGSARQAVWDALQAKRVARFPFPPHGRIPNFAGARQAAERLLQHPIFRRLRVIKVNPDSPQRWVRQFALERGITVTTPTPQLKGAFRILDPARIPRQQYAEAATLKRGGKWGRDVSLAQMPKVDLVVMGSVAVTRDGRRLGKGHGYADLEYALLRELGNPAVPLVTTVHPLQLVDAFPVEGHDAPLTLIATPDEVIEVKHRRRAPRGIDWKRLPREALEAMPLLAELRRRRRPGCYSTGHPRVERKARP
ncbi:MAG TPA: 5-formyltetrahydrofolate cyclo-ligase [Burkholderiales bacterium]|nr:5-formyltetrahydrofolate cyclo-ligase [Burkholderiales bacterium]